MQTQLGTHVADARACARPQYDCQLPQRQPKSHPKSV